MDDKRDELLEVAKAGMRDAIRILDPKLPRVYVPGPAREAIAHLERTLDAIEERGSDEPEDAE